MSQMQTISWAAALCLTGMVTYAVAQPKAGHGKMCGDECPMRQIAELSDLKVEATKQGAIIQLVAKRSEDVSKVQDSARQLAAKLSSGECPMHAGHGGMHQQGHQHPAPSSK